MEINTNPDQNKANAANVAKQQHQPMSPFIAPLVKSSSSAAIDNRQWTVADIGQNSIASVLNDPTGNIGAAQAIGQKLDSVTRQALLAIPKTNIKHIKQKEFDGYLSRIKDIYAVYEEQMKNLVEETQVLFDEEALKNMKAGGAKPSTKPLDHSAVETIPKVFFESDFSLENPRTFEQVTEYSSVVTAVPSIGSNNKIASNVLLQEKLSHYLDTVEVHLVQEISARSLEFFAALSNIQSLHQETLDCLNNIKSIRTALSTVSNDQAKKGLEVLRKKKRRNNMMILYECIKIIKDVKKTQPTIQILLNQGDFVGALNLIAQANASLKGASVFKENSDDGQSNALFTAMKNGTVKPFNLQGVRVLVHLSGQLAEMTKMIEKLMDESFTKAVQDTMEDLMTKSLKVGEDQFEWAKKMLLSETLENSSDGLNLPITIEDLAKEEFLRIKLAPLILGLIRTEKITSALQNYKDRLTKHFVKKITKQYFPSAASTDQNEASGNDGTLAKYFRTLNLEAFMEILRNTFLVLLQFFRKIAVLNEIIVLALKDVEKNGVVIGEVKNSNTQSNNTSSVSLPINSTASNYSQVISEVNNVLFETADTAHVRCGKILVLREEQNKQLNFKDFFRMYDLISRFIVVSEAICKQRSSIGLRGTLMTQAKGFLNYFHMERLKQLTQIVEHDSWAHCDVPYDYQAIVNTLTGMNEKELENVTKTEHTETEDDDNKSGKKLSNVQSGLVINKKVFKVSAACLVAVDHLDKYILCAKQIPILTPDVVNRIVELLKGFNSKICDALVAGNTQVLKSINPKNLSLAAQSLGVIISLIPFLRTRLEVYLPPRHQILLKEFDAVVEDLAVNQSKLFHRIITIMGDLLNSTCGELNKINWDDQASASPDKPTEVMKQLVLNTKKLHNTLKKYLFPERIKAIYDEIFGIYNKFLENQYANIIIHTSGGKNKLLIDVQHYISELSTLDYVDGPGNALEVIVNNIRIRDKREKVLPNAPSITHPPTQSNVQSAAAKASAMLSGLTNAMKPKVANNS